MGLYRVTRVDAQALLGCGHDVTFVLSDLKVKGNRVLFPICPECRRAMFTVISVDHGKNVPSGVLERDTAIHTLHKRVHELGQYADGTVRDDISSAMHPLAKNDAVVEAPSARRVREA